MAMAAATTTTTASSPSSLLPKQFVKAPRSTDGGRSSSSLGFLQSTDLRRLASSNSPSIPILRPRRALVEGPGSSATAGSIGVTASPQRYLPRAQFLRLMD